MMARPLDRSIARAGDRGLPVIDYDVLLRTVHDIATLDPSITVSAGAPTPQWTVIESDGKQYNYTGASITHNRVAVGDMTLRLGPAALGAYVTTLDYNQEGWKGTITLSEVQRMPNLAVFRALNNANLTVDVSFADIPEGITQWNLFGTVALPAGELSEITATTISYLNIGTVNGPLTIDLADLPSSMSLFHTLSATGRTLENSGKSVVALQLGQLRMEGLSAPQAEVDAIIDRIYADRALFTQSGLQLNIAGNNAAPSGTYQYSATPSTGKEKIYALVNDDDGEGFNTWSITYTE